MEDYSIEPLHTPHTKKSWFSSITDKHESYLGILWGISVTLGMIYGGIRLLYAIFIAIRIGDFWGFVLAVVFNSLFMMFYGFIGGAVVFIILFLITIIPYLVIRGISK